MSEIVSSFLIWRSARMWQNDALQIFIAWWSNDIVLSIVTPSVRTTLDTEILFPPSATTPISPSLLCLAPVPTTMASDLSGFKASPLRVNHRLTALKQSFITSSDYIAEYADPDILTFLNMVKILICLLTLWLSFEPSILLISSLEYGHHTECA